MRGDDEICGSLFSYVDVEDRVRADHPLRVIREIANAALGVKYDLSRESIRLILDRDRRRIERTKRMKAKAHHLGFRGH